MADGLTSSVQVPFVAGSSGSSQRLSPTILDLGSFQLTYNPVRQAVSGLFASASSGSVFASLNAFVAVATAGTQPSAPVSAQQQSNAAAQAAYTTALQLVLQETPAQAYLKFLLSQTVAPSTVTAASPAPSAPKISANTGASVAEGGTAFITSDALSATAGGAPDSGIVYSITGGPSNGYLALASAPNTAIASFTQQDVTAGLVEYINNGKPQTGDSFTFNISGGSGTTAQGTFNISITPPQAGPVLRVAANTGASLTEGGSTVITAAQLDATDSAYGSGKIDYYVTSQPANGHLELSTNPGVAISSFTQKNVDAGQLVYVHNGTNATSDSFTFKVAAGTQQLLNQTFNISVTPVSPNVTTDTGATVTQGSSVTLTNANLSATDASEPASSITYTITSSPANGYLQLAGNPGVSITSFTQADINAGNVQYVHNGSATTSDAFSFTVSGGNGAAPTSGNFDISVTPAPPDITGNTGATVTEGSTVTLTTANLDASGLGSTPSDLVYNIASSPSYGTLQLSTNPGTAITSFTEADLQAGLVQYVNGGAKASADSFTFNVSDASGASAYQSFNISVTLTPPTLDTNTAATVNEGSTVTLTTSNLHASDQGGVTDASIIYNLTSPLSSGYLQLSSNPGAQINSFTQAQLSAGVVQYVNNGTSEATTDAFSFTLSDGYTTSSTSTFNINVTPVAPVITANTGTTVSRLAGSTIITASELSASDPGTAASSINFNVSGGLSKGYLDLTTNPGVQITSFTEAQLQAGIVQYVHTALGLASDSFTFTVADNATSAPATFNINVTV